MLRDVFYFNKKPNVHPREKQATSLEDARSQSTTEHFWIINEFCDYTGFDWDWDFEFLHDEDVWAELISTDEADSVQEPTVLMTE